jgi:hypothetical protein
LTAVVNNVCTALQEFEVVVSGIMKSQSSEWRVAVVSISLCVTISVRWVLAIAVWCIIAKKNIYQKKIFYEKSILYYKW